MCICNICIVYIYIYHISHTPYIDIHIPLFPLIIRAIGFDPTVSSEFQLAPGALCVGGSAFGEELIDGICMY